MNVLGHLTPAERDTLWARLAERLTPDGRIVLNLSPPTTPESVPATPMADVTLGEHRYLGTAAAEPAGPDAVTWTMTYRVQDGERVVTELAAADHWHVLTTDQLAAKARPTASPAPRRTPTSASTS